MRGMNATTGRAVAGDEHLAQSIADVLTTPIGTRVMRRDYGSLLPELLDQPWNPLSRLRAFAAVALALTRWEPRISLRRVALAPMADRVGAFLLELEGHRADELGRTSFTRLTLPLRARSAPAAVAL